MAVTKSYTVHSAQDTEVEVQAKIGTRVVTATVPGMVVELTEVGGPEGHTFSFVPDTDELLGECQTLFVVGNTVTVTFSKGQS